jgi:ADP-heptose:LPS heptosyltransferase
MDCCTLVMSNDTGLMHLAAARKRKVVAIFGSTVKQFGFFPYGTENLLVENAGLACRPCSHIGLQKCPEGHFRCMKDIQVDAVFAAAQQLLGPGKKYSLAHDEPTRN